MRKRACIFIKIKIHTSLIIDNYSICVARLLYHTMYFMAIKNPAYAELKITFHSQSHLDILTNCQFRHQVYLRVFRFFHNPKMAIQYRILN